MELAELASIFTVFADLALLRSRSVPASSSNSWTSDWSEKTEFTQTLHVQFYIRYQKGSNIHAEIWAASGLHNKSNKFRRTMRQGKVLGKIAESSGHSRCRFHAGTASVHVICPLGQSISLSRIWCASQVAAVVLLVGNFETHLIDSTTYVVQIWFLWVSSLKLDMLPWKHGLASQLHGSWCERGLSCRLYSLPRIASAAREKAAAKHDSRCTSACILSRQPLS